MENHDRGIENGIAGSVVPYTYAAPSAGNAAFANWQSTNFAGVRVYNTLDVVPLAWADLLSIPNLYPSPGPSCPRWFAEVIEFVNALVQPLQYAQPSTGDQQRTGTVQAGLDFFDEAADQHGHNTYLTLLNAPILPFLAETTRVMWSALRTTGVRETIGEVRRPRSAVHDQQQSPRGKR